MLAYLLFFIGFILLIKGADFLVDGASEIAKKFRVSDLIIGLTIVAFGTSAPEFIVNIISSMQGNTEIAIGNIIGSNIINILLILGISSIIFPIEISENTIRKEIPMCLFISLILGLMVNDSLIFNSNLNAEISRFEGFILLLIFLLFMYYIYKITRKINENEKEVVKIDVKNLNFIKSLFLIIVGLIGINVGAKWVIDGAVEIASFLNVSQSLIAITIIAFGTSLPELSTSVIAAFKKNSDIAIGNILGSNIFNILLILGVSSIIRPLKFNVVGNIDILVTILAPLFLFIVMFTGKKKNTLERWEGFILLFLYTTYLIFTIIRS